MMMQDEAIGWDPAYEGSMELTWLTLVELCLIAVLLVVYCKALHWLVVRRIHLGGWRATRHALPTAMLLLTVPLLFLNESVGGPVIERLTGLLVCLNLPAYPGVLAIAAISETLNTGWPIVVSCVAAGWLTWFGTIRIIECRHEDNTPLTLNLSASSSRSDN